MLTAKALIRQCICIVRSEPLLAAHLGRLQTKKVKSRSYFLVGQVQGKENRLKCYRKISFGIVKMITSIFLLKHDGTSECVAQYLERSLRK